MAGALFSRRRDPGGTALAGFVDVETTGLSWSEHDVVEFAIALFAFRPDSGEIFGIVDKYSGLRDPGRPIPPEATKIHGIRDEDVRGKRLDERLVRSLMEQAVFFVAHNASFDRPFVSRLFPEAGEKPWLCSMNGVPWKELGFPSKGLQNLLRAHRIRPGRAHRGLDDVEAALKLLAGKAHNGTHYFRYVLERHPGAAELALAAARPQAEKPVAGALWRRSWWERLIGRGGAIDLPR